MMKKQYLKIGIYSLMAVLFIIGIFLLYQNLTDESESNYYLYSNGYSEFEVTKISTIETRIPVYVENTDGSHTQVLVTFRNDPVTIEDIEIDRDIYNKLYDDEVIYVTLDPVAGYGASMILAALEIQNILESSYLPYQIPVASGFTQVSEKNKEIPVVTCSDASLDWSVIVLEVADDNRVFSDGYCIYVQGKTEDEVIAAADRLVYYMLGIVP